MNKSDFEKEISKYEVDLEAQAVVSKWLQEHEHTFLLDEDGHCFRVQFMEDGPYILLVVPPKNIPVRPIWMVAFPNFWPIPVANVDIAYASCAKVSAHEVLAKLYPVYDEEAEFYRMHAVVETFAASPEHFMECFHDTVEILQNSNQAFFTDYARRALADGRSMQSVFMGMNPKGIKNLLKQLLDNSGDPELTELLNMLNI